MADAEELEIDQLYVRVFDIVERLKSVRHEHATACKEV
jgi:hypothetical protein